MDSETKKRPNFPKFVMDLNIKEEPFGIRSIRLEKQKEGKAKGFWKGITSTEAQEFSFTVGITSTDSNSTSAQSAMKLNSSLESGWNESGTLEAGGSFMGIGAKVSGTIGHESSEKKEESREN